ncbi:HepT-like ribonuclease domain-containing protein [Pedobacter endophyticus]|uniref:HepT-like ribonuclease domain-containing protein n=1 Tax=Pedobacter endophyticus TaxID=2789740 RepID=UPI001E3A1924|nr:HepT-like ribonuclease domain-containing protein [Pedobacter endophyticus]
MIRSLEIIGEASSKLDDEFRHKYPHIEWRKILSTRNKLIHNYFGIDYDIVWDIVVNKLPNLKIFLEEILAGH